MGILDIITPYFMTGMERQEETGMTNMLCSKRDFYTTKNAQNYIYMYLPLSYMIYLHSKQS